MAGETGFGLGVDEVVITEYFFTKLSENGIVFFEFCSGVDVIVVVIVFAIVAEPRLSSFGEVFEVVGSGVFVFPEAFGHGVLIGFLEAVIEGGVDVGHSSQVDVVGEFMDHDGFGGIGVAGEGE